MSTMASQITGVSIVCSAACSGADEKTPKLRVTDLCEGIPPVIDGFPSQRDSNAANVSIWWRHHGIFRWWHRGKLPSQTVLVSSVADLDTPLNQHQGLCSLSGKTSYRKISWSLEAARFAFKLFQSLWNLAGTSAALLPRCLSNVRAIRPMQHPISRLRDFTRFGGKTSYRLVNRGPEEFRWNDAHVILLPCSDTLIITVLQWDTFWRTTGIRTFRVRERNWRAFVPIPRGGKLSLLW